jgi:pyruvate dehydrogenase E2 component (dihydrolipoamide acetyltransferase)
MASEIVMPRMGLTMEEGTLVNWLKSEGQPVTAGEMLFEIETDKSTVEIEATGSGVLGRILVKVGETVPVGTVIAILLAEGEALPVGSAAAAGPQKVVSSTVPPTKTEAAGQKIPVQGTSAVKASPAARKIARQLAVDLRGVTGTGPNGRVVAWNVSAAGTATRTKLTPLAARKAAGLGLNLSEMQGSGPGGRITRKDLEKASNAPAIPSNAAAGTIRPFTKIEQVMGNRMVESFTSAPHFYLHVTVDARKLVALRDQLKEKLESRSGIHLTYTDLLVYFCSRALLRHPDVMSQWTPQGMRVLNEANIAVAVDTERGLLVPVIRNAGQMGLTDISRTLSDLTERARQGHLLPSDQEQGVFTISNLGAFGIDGFDAVLNPPQAALLAVGRIREQALVEEGRIVPAAMLNLSLSVDHRVLDGARAARFLGTLAELLETPALSME